MDKMLARSKAQISNNIKSEVKKVGLIQIYIMKSSFLRYKPGGRGGRSGLAVINEKNNRFHGLFFEHDIIINICHFVGAERISILLLCKYR